MGTLQSSTNSLVTSTTELSNICGDLWKPPWYLSLLPIKHTIMAISCFFSTDSVTSVTVESSYLPWLVTTELSVPLWPRSWYTVPRELCCMPSASISPITRLLDPSRSMREDMWKPPCFYCDQTSH